MTDAAWALLALTAVVAAVNWWSVAGTDPGEAREGRWVEWVSKPGAMVGLIGVALAIDPTDGTRRWLFVVALTLSLAGDVFLMFPKERFVEGLSAFLLAHVFYIAGLARDASLVGVLLALVPVVAFAALLGRRIVRAVREKDRRLVPPVVAYLVVISVMVTLALGVGEAIVGLGAVLFYGSDAMIGWRKFVRRFRFDRVAVMATYHVGQALLVLTLARRL